MTEVSMCSSASSTELTPEEERIMIRDIALTAEANSKEGDTFYVITQRFLSTLSFLKLLFCDIILFVDGSPSPPTSCKDGLYGDFKISFMYLYPYMCFRDPRV